MLEKIAGAAIGNMTFSDHAPVSLHLKMGETEAQGTGWRLNEDLLADNVILKRLKEELEWFFKINIPGEVNEATIWEAHKTYIRGILMMIGGERNKRMKNQRLALTREIHRLEQQHKISGETEVWRTLLQKREELRTFLEQETRKTYYLVKKERYINNNKPGRHLARTLKKKKTSNYIERIRNSSGEIKYKTQDIAKTFQKFYEALYAIKASGTQEQVKHRQEASKMFLKEANLKKITEEDSNMLDAPVTLQEVKRAIQDIPNGKSPGPDGLSALYYKKLQEPLLPILCSYINWIGENWEIRKQALEANIAVIKKEGKDGTTCSGYRPISLLNIDIKIYAKILADRLKRVIKEVIHPDQVGFVPGREGKDNGIKTLMVTQIMKDREAPGLLLSIDAEKAFDRVDWGFMWNTLEELGIGNKMIKKIRALYTHPMARVKINGTLSEAIELKNGTRQGCPLSPLLFVLTLEPLLATIRHSPDISGIKIGEDEYKIAAFADDVLLYVTRPRITLPNILATLRNYGQLSNFRVNATKSEVMEVVEEKGGIRPTKRAYLLNGG